MHHFCEISLEMQTSCYCWISTFFGDRGYAKHFNARECASLSVLSNPNYIHHLCVRSILGNHLLQFNFLGHSFGILNRIMNLSAGSPIKESTLTKAIAGLNETISLVLDFLQDSKVVLNHFQQCECLVGEILCFSLILGACSYYSQFLNE